MEDSVALVGRWFIHLCLDSHCTPKDYTGPQPPRIPRKTQRRHLKTHSGEKSHKGLHVGLSHSASALQCDYASSQAGDLRRHLITHSGEKPNKSNVTMPALIRVHLKSHNGEKPKKVQPMWLGIFSGSQFEKTLDNTQHGEKQNRCNQCDYASSQASNLRTHFKTHNGEKSNKCDQCDFASSWTHMLYRNPEKYRYLIFKNPCICIWVQSRYSTGACWRGQVEMGWFCTNLNWSWQKGCNLIWTKIGARFGKNPYLSASCLEVWWITNGDSDVECWWLVRNGRNH